MNDDDLVELRAEQDRILAMPGRAAWVKLATLRRTARIFTGNASALLGYIKRMEDPAVLLPTLSDQRGLEEFLDETERHLHNYVAAAQSRVDHFRRFKRHDMPEAIQTEYQQRINQDFDTSPLRNFVTDLRNLVLHVRLPVPTTRESWERGGTLTFQVMLDAADLLRWDGWSLPAQQYIRDSGDAVDLEATVSTYTSEIMAFDRWLAERVIGEHLEEIESYLHEARQFQERLRQLGLYRDPEDRKDLGGP